MTEISVNVDEVVAKELRVRDKRIALLESRLEKAEKQRDELRTTLQRLAAAKEALLAAADWLDPWRYED